MKGKKVYLTPSYDEVFTTYARGERVSPERARSFTTELRSNVQEITRNDVFTPVNGVRMKVNATRAGTQSAAADLLKALRAQPNVEAAYPAFRRGKEKVYVGNQITFIAKPGKEASIAEFLRANRASRTEEIDLGNKKLVVASVGKGKSVFGVASRLYESGLVEYAEPEFTFTGTNDATPNDPLFSSQWFLNQASDADIDAPEAWNITKGSGSVVVAVIDGNGYDLSHPDIAAKTVAPYDAVNDDNDPSPENMDANHGTPCMGLIAGATNNGAGVASVGYNVKVLPISMGYNASGNGFYTSSTIIARAAARVVATAGVVAISNSYSFYGSDFAASVEASYVSMRQNSRNGLGAVILASTANDGLYNPVRYPASYNDVIGVGATSSDDLRAGFSNYGDLVDIVAPGVGTYTLDRLGADGYSSDGYVYFSGTSAACPVAAGVVGLIASINPKLTRVQLESLLQRSCDKVGGYTYTAGYPFGAWNNEMGYGRVNAFKGVQLAVGLNKSPVLAAIGSKTLSLGQSLGFTASATDPEGGVLTFSLVGAPAGASINPVTGAFAWTPTGTGSYPFTVRVRDNAYVPATDEEKIIVTVNPAVAGAGFRVNAGGTLFATLDARSFVADAYFAGGVVSRATTLGIAGTADDYLYQTGRHGTSFSYNFPTGNGSYDVVLHFAETYFGSAAPGGTGSRKFHVDLEGVRKLTDYDVFARAGGALRVAQETFRVTVSDGTLNVAFLKGSADNPAVKAIEVLPAGSALTINAGGTAYTTGTGKKFAADSYYAAGTLSSIAGGEILNTTDDVLYRNARVGVFSYGLPSGNGTFDVTLHFAETYWGSRAAGGIGSRKFNVDAEGVRRLTNYDIFAKTGGAMRAAKETIRVTVSDGVLNLYFSKGTADNPLVSAIEVVPAPVVARVAAADANAGDGDVHLYPNPAAGRLTVQLPFPAASVQSTAVRGVTGNALLTDAHRVSGENEIGIEVGALRGGVYLLEIDAPHGRKTVKFVKQ
ncbi:MAG: S8 family serine peptidase [Cytophagales bacterium]|nr:S8 family serine peptidase [Cytophagales bacterium]